MARNRSLLLVRLAEMTEEERESLGGDSVLNSVPLGSLRDVADQLAQFNTAADGAPESVGTLYGPGLIVTLPMIGPDDPVMQAMVSMTEEEMAWPVLERICRTLKWKMMDPGSGRTFG